jgi:hypothetical protein
MDTYAFSVRIETYMEMSQAVQLWVSWTCNRGNNKMVAKHIWTGETMKCNLHGDENQPNRVCKTGSGEGQGKRGSIVLYRTLVAQKWSNLTLISGTVTEGKSLGGVPWSKGWWMSRSGAEGWEHGRTQKKLIQIQIQKIVCIVNAHRQGMQRHQFEGRSVWGRAS